MKKLVVVGCAAVAAVFAAASSLGAIGSANAENAPASQMTAAHPKAQLTLRQFDLIDFIGTPFRFVINPFCDILANAPSLRHPPSGGVALSKLQRRPVDIANAV